MTNFHKFSGDPKCIPTSQRSFIGHLNDKFFVAKPSYSFDSGFIHSFTETRRKSCLIYKPLNKSLFEEGQKQKLATKDTEEKQRSQRKIWEKQVTKIRRKPQRILGIVVQPPSAVLCAEVTVIKS